MENKTRKATTRIRKMNEAPSKKFTRLLKDANITFNEADEMKTYTKNNFWEKLKDKEWKSYRKKVDTKATRMNSPFHIETSEGMLSCRDGYIAIDARGYPYPIAEDEFDLIYDEVVESTKAKPSANVLYDYTITGK